MRLDAILQSWMRRRGLDRTSLKASQQLVQRGEVEVDGAVITDPKYQVVCGLETVSIAAGVAGAGEPSGSSSARGGTCERVVVETEEQPLYVMNKPTGATSQQRPGLRARQTHTTLGMSVRRGRSGPYWMATCAPRGPQGTPRMRDAAPRLPSGVSPPRALRRHPREPSVYDLVPESLRRDGLVAFGRLDVDTTGALLFGTDGGLQTLLTMPTGGVWKVHRRSVSSLTPVIRGPCLTRITRSGSGVRG
jgi:16S rRNA U516 pseudouridylate synthase RsuA-like enzyme